MDEFEAIEKFFNQPLRDPRVILGIGDDAAVVCPDAGMDLVISTDTLVDNVHFLMDWSPECIARRALNVNVSDMVAMGATPCWISLALTMPALNEPWLKRFTESLHSLLQHYNMQLVGGDTTKGPLTISITIHGIVEHGQAIRRSGAQNTDHIYVSGSLGAAALAVKMLEDGADFSHTNDAILLDALRDPKPRMDLLPVLRQFATSAIDISDGLAADLEHLCEQSHCGAVIHLPDIPVHPLVVEKRGVDALGFALSGGDDYEICFTVSDQQRAYFEQFCSERALTMHRIGRIRQESEVCFLDEKHHPVVVSVKGYQHF